MFIIICNLKLFTRKLIVDGNSSGSGWWCRLQVILNTWQVSTGCIRAYVMQRIVMLNVFYRPKDVDQGNGYAQQENTDKQTDPGHVTVGAIKVHLESMAHRNGSRLRYIVV